ncbi:MAG: EAL domain-containing protein [Wenzhouxiangellaceae bacterium]|nr:EAL domain-containing protein [Wenzhouxiangellaceae bacterium]
MPDPSGLNLLLIEDNPADALLLERQLARDRINCRIERINTTAELLHALRQPRDAVLYDYTVPGMEFHQTITTIQQDRPDLPIVLVSGTVTETMAVDLLRYGIADFVLKDNLTRLASTVQRSIRAARERSGRIQAETALLKLGRAVEQSPAAIVITDTQPRIEFVNQAFIKSSGYREQELIGSNPSLLNQGLTPPEVYDELWATLQRGEIWHGEFHNTRKNGETYIEEATIAPIRQPDGTVTHYVGIKSDISDQRQTRKLVHELAYYDQLTGLANRSLLLERLSKARSGLLLVIDIDGFKFINDLNGHETGDRILNELARRLSNECKGTDALVARIAGNRFAVLLSIEMDREQAPDPALVERIERHKAALERPYSEHHEGQADIALSVSIGASLFEQQTPADQVLNRAEIALQQARAKGRGHWRLFDPALQQQIEQRLTLQNELTRALDQDQFRLHFQSVFDAAGQVVGAEALLRWQHPDGRLVAPGAFIEAAEESGLIVAIGNWVIEQGCRLLAKWAEQPATATLQLAINISPQQFHQPDFVARLRHCLLEHRIVPERLVLELTESVVMDNLTQGQARMHECRELGVRFALDDFGTGYSSLAYLKHLPFATLKIDQAFVADMLEDESDEAIVRATVALGQALKLRVVAEGVETRAQFDALKGLGCAYFQGFLLARPVPIADWSPRSFQS